eukprot:s2345_g18.t1
MLPGTWLKWLVAFTAWQCHNAVFQEFAKEAEALEALKKDKALASKVENAEVSQLIRNGWWQLCRELVLTSHGLPGFGSLEKAVRQEVTQLKLNADDLLLSLSPQDDSRIGVVRCATQWAQNSSAIFLSIKFAHRWSSPGALKVQDEKIEVSPCCFNFTASGDHSQLKKRYALDLAFYGEVDPDHWSWQLASAGRMTTECLGHHFDY